MASVASCPHALIVSSPRAARTEVHMPCPRSRAWKLSTDSREGRRKADQWGTCDEDGAKDSGGDDDGEPGKNQDQDRDRDLGQDNAQSKRKDNKRL